MKGYTLNIYVLADGIKMHMLSLDENNFIKTFMIILNKTTENIQHNWDMKYVYVQ